MIHVDFDIAKWRAKDPAWWNAWEKKSTEATDEVLDIWESWKKQFNESPDDAPKLTIRWKNTVWGELKEWLLKNVFHFKCAYCETHIPRHYNDAEHHRPKGGVAVIQNGKTQAAITMDETGKTINHPGYFWLAYNAKNLLPSCEKCNSGEGKQNQYPLTKNKRHILFGRLTSKELAKLRGTPCGSKCLNGVYYLDPDDLNDFEEPLLLHPYFDEPRHHLRFEYAGVETPRNNSERGEESISVFVLKDTELRRARQRIQEDALREFLMICASTSGNIEQKIETAYQGLAKYFNGQEPYSAAACDYVDEFSKKLKNP